MSQKAINIGIGGFGTVGSGVYEVLEKNRTLISARTKQDFRVIQVAVRDLKKPRPISVPENILTDNYLDIIENPEVDLVVELMGGTKDAYDFVVKALKAKKPVITGNKALLAEYGVEIFRLSQEMQTPLYFEAAVAGGIPIIDSMRESLVCNQFLSIVGIINGTSNYILERMSTAGLDYKTALQEAQSLGYAEADPTLDVNGGDAAHKALLLALLAYGRPISAQDIYVSGIEKVGLVDIHFAEKLGYVIKLLAVIRRHNDDLIELRVQPSFVSKKHILSSVNGVFNAIAVLGDIVGETLFFGRGAGKNPTSSAVISDIALAARDLLAPDNVNSGFIPYCKETQVMPVEDTETPYYVRFVVSDTTGIIASIALVLAKHHIGISGTNSMPRENSSDQDLVFILHRCPFGNLQNALKEVAELPGVSDQVTVFRIEKLASE